MRQAPGGWEVAVIEPRREADSGGKGAKKRQKQVLALPKGLVDPGEKPDPTAIREVREATGIQAINLAKLTDIKYMYVRSWGDKQRVFKIVSFYLLHYESGEIDDIKPEMRAEYVKQIPMGRFAQPADVANAILFLACAESGYITGQVLVVDGGMTA